ncbi:MAG: histidine kinase [Ramlibacter sp.]|nr:histidine kinase [Ramlibacter sp.]
MNSRFWIRLALAACALFATAAGAGITGPAQGRATITELTQARATITANGVTTVADVVLPYHLDREQRGRPAQATFEVPFRGTAALDHLHGLYLSRVGNSARIWINDNLVADLGDITQANDDDYAKAPQYVPIPAQLLRGDNLIRIELRGDAGRRAGLSSLLIGPDHEVLAIYQQAFRWRMSASLVVAVFSLLVGTVALVLWATQPESVPGRTMRDGIYLSAGVAEFCWALRVGDIAIQNPPLPWPAWGVVVTAAFAGWICGMALFCHHAAGWHRHPSMAWMRIAMMALFGTSILASTLSYTLHRPVFLTTWLGFANLFFVAYAAVYLAAALRAPTRARLLVGLAGALNVAVGVRDWLAIRISGDYAQSTWIRYSSVLFGLALGYIVITRFRAASAQASDLMANLAARVSEKEQELSLSYARLGQLAREHERAAERSRILRDMHDGVGSHLSSAIRQLESGRAQREQVLQTLRDSLDQLKLSIDAMNLPAGDVTALLANLRYRLEPRFAALDLELQWHVDDLPAVPGLDAAAMRHLQFMLFEALSNVLQHARARVLRIEASALGGGALLRIVDDGCGFDVGQPLRKGLRTMQERAAAIGARLSLESHPGRTVVGIVLAGVAV